MLLLDYNDKLQKERKKIVVHFALPLLPEVRTWLNQLTIILHFSAMLLKMKHKISLSFFFAHLRFKLSFFKAFNFH